jgi:hypothetical protein
MSLPIPKNKPIAAGNALKLYVFPVLVTVLASLIWRDVTEMRSDIKALLAQSNIDKTKIETLERDVKSLEQAVFNKKAIVQVNYPLKDGLYYKHEEIFNIDKYLPKKTII